MIVDITELGNNGRQGALIDPAPREFRFPEIGGFIRIVDDAERFRKLIILIVASFHDAPLSVMRY